jgi:hypothetical protein
MYTLILVANDYHATQHKRAGYIYSPCVLYQITIVATLQSGRKFKLYEWVISRKNTMAMV